MGRLRKKGQAGAAKAYITRTAAVKKLQCSLADFRRLCILKGGSMIPQIPRPFTHVLFHKQVSILENHGPKKRRTRVIQPPLRFTMQRTFNTSNMNPSFASYVNTRRLRRNLVEPWAVANGVLPRVLRSVNPYIDWIILSRRGLSPLFLYQQILTRP